MCGIVGIISNNNAISAVLDGLKSLEYRGYDSVGIGYIFKKKIKEIKSVGKISSLNTLYNKKKDKSSIVIGHTRWATHGKPTKRNAHPFIKKNCALVHNGIIENSESLIKKYKINIKLLKSNTDSEIVAEIFNQLYKKNVLILHTARFMGRTNNNIKKASSIGKKITLKL